MNKFLQKVGQFLLASMIGYEFSENVSATNHETIVVKVDESRNNNVDDSIESLTITNIIIISLLVIAICIAIVKACLNLNKRERREEVIEMRQRPQMPIV